MVVGLPGAGLWALAVLLVAVVQLPTMLIMLPVVAYAFTFLSTLVAVVFAIWCLAVGLIDNVLKPIFFSRGVKVPVLVIFVGAVGGLASSGIIGLFTGSVILSIGYEIVRAWVFQDEAQRVDAAADASA
jgi:predicted PurR-regulated permease PerM